LLRTPAATPAFFLSGSRIAGMQGDSGLRDRFLAWQCRIRQIAMRQDGGRPSPGMGPQVLSSSGSEIAPALTVLLVRKEPEESTALFRYQVQKEADRRELYERGLAILQADYFQLPQLFSDHLAAVLPKESAVADRLIGDGVCTLAFDQFSQRFSLACGVSELAIGEAMREAALWHNRLFNPLLPDSVRVLAFRPDWAASSASP
jgi:hypothetical protein